MKPVTRRRLKIASAVIGVLIVVAIVVALLPGFQRGVILGQLQKIDPDASLERIHVTPFSAEVKGLQLRTPQWAVALESLEAEISPWSLPFKHLKVESATVTGLAVEITSLEEADDLDEEEDQPIPGLLALTETGFKLSLDNLTADVAVTLPELETTVQVTGGGLAPEATGAFSIEPLTLNLPGQEQLRRVTVTGTLELTEAERGAIDRIVWDMKAVAEGALFDEEAVLLVSGELDDAGAPNDEDDEGPVYPPENLKLTVRESGEGDSPLLDLESELVDNGRKFNASFSLAANNATLDPFALALDLPEFHGTGEGHLTCDLYSLEGESTMRLDAELSELERISQVLAGVGALKVEENHALTFDSEKIVLSEFAFAVTQPGNATVLDVAISNPLTFRLLDAGSVLEGLSGKWLTLAVEVPLDWFDPLLGGFEMEGGDLAGKLTFAGSPLEKMTVAAPEPLRVDNASIYRDDTQLLDKVSMRLTPAAEVAPKQIRVSMTGVRIQARGQDLLTSDAKALLDLTAPEGFRAAIDAEMEAFARGIVQQELEAEKKRDKETPFSAARRRIAAANQAMGQASLKMTVKASAVPDRLTAESVSLRLTRLEDNEALADVGLAAPVTAVFDEEAVSFDGLDGPWLKAAFTGMPVSVPAIFVDDLDLSGGDIKGAFVLGANETPGGFQLEFTEPLNITALSVAREEQTLLSEADVHLTAKMDYQPGRLQVHLADFVASSNQQLLLSGGLDSDIALKQFQPQRVTFRGTGRAGLNGLLAQPLLKPYLVKPLSQPIVATMAVDGESDLKSLKLSRLEGAVVVQDGAELANFKAVDDFVVTQLAMDGLPAALESVQGSGTLMSRGFPLWLPLSFVQADPWLVTSGTVDSAFNWQVGQGKATLTPTEDLKVNALGVSKAAKPFLEKVSVETRPSIALTGQDAKVTVDAIRLSAAGAEPLTGDLATTVAFEKDFPVQSLAAHMSGPVAPWFRQPLMPKNALSGGALNASAKVAGDGKASFDASLDNVAFGGKTPYIKSAYAEGSVQINTGGLKITGTVPATLETVDGTTDAKTEFTYIVENGEPSSTLVVNGKLLRLADFQHIARAFVPVVQVKAGKHKKTELPGGLSEAGTREKLPPYEQEAAEHGAHPQKSVAAAENKSREEATEEAEDEPAPEEIDFAKLSEEAAKPKATDPDKEPFWKDLPHTAVGFRFEEVLYRGYVRFSEVAGEATAHREYLSLDAFSARFHEASIEAKSRLDWNEDAMPKPYALQSNAQVKDFDLSAFFGELVPGEKPRVEGLFRMSADAGGSFPSVPQARNFVTFALDLESRSGLFRAIPPNSGLAQTTSGTAAFFGEVFSYVPTSVLGMGTLSRLVSYMREVPYKLVSLNIVRETDLNIRIERMEVRSDQMLILGRGGILYEEDVDLLDQRFDLTAAMDARGEFAAILSGLGLLTDKPAGNNFWRGFDFRIWGSLAKPKTNFDNIVTQASSGTLTRNVTNPFHGIWSNIKYGGEGPEPEDESGPPAKDQP